MAKDRCTLFPDKNYKGCCHDHDKAYKLGTGKWRADVELYECVRDAGRPIIAGVMFAGVTVFGWPFYGYHALMRKIKNS